MIQPMKEQKSFVESGSSPPPSALTIEAFARELSMSPREVRRWIADRRIAVVRFGRSVRIRRSTLERLVEKGIR